MDGRENTSGCHVESTGELFLDCFQRPCARAPRCTERVGESRSHFCGDGCFLAPHGCKRWSRARFCLARPSLAALFFVCSQARRGGSRGGARGEAATAPTAICSGVVGGRRYYEEGSHGAQVVFFSSIPARLCAFSDSGRWQLRVAAGYGHRARRQGHFGAWVCLLGSWGWFRPLSAVAGPAELAFLVKTLFLNWA